MAFWRERERGRLSSIRAGWEQPFWGPTWCNSAPWCLKVSTSPGTELQTFKTFSPSYANIHIWAENVFSSHKWGSNAEKDHTPCCHYTFANLHSAVKPNSYSEITSYVLVKLIHPPPSISAPSFPYVCLKLESDGLLKSYTLHVSSLKTRK